MPTIHDSAKSGDHEALRRAFTDRFLRKRADPNTPDTHGLPPIMYASDAGAVDILVGAGAAVNPTLRGGAHPVLAAVLAGLKDVVGALLKHGSSADGAQPRLHSQVEWQTPLFAALQRDREDIAELLIAHGADVNTGSAPDGITPLHAAARDGRATRVKLLLDAGADPNAQAYMRRLDARDEIVVEENETPLHLAARSGHEEVVDLLLTFPAIKINAFRHRSHDDALSLAAAEGHVEVVKALLGAGADVNAGNPLHSAISGPYGGLDSIGRFKSTLARRETIARLLIEHGADVNLMRFKTPLHVSASFGGTFMSLLLEHGADVNALGNAGTPLCEACSSAAVLVGDPVGTVRRLLEAGADPTLKGGWRAPLGIVEVMIERGTESEETTRRCREIRGLLEQHIRSRG